MTPVIKPDICNILCNKMDSASENQESSKKKSKSKPSRWEKIKTWVRETCEMIKPIVDIVVSLSEAILPLAKVYYEYRKYSEERRRAYA